MPNDERMTNDAMTNRLPRLTYGPFGHSLFGFLSSLGIGHSSFVPGALARFAHRALRAFTLAVRPTAERPHHGWTPRIVFSAAGKGKKQRFFRGWARTPDSGSVLLPCGT